MKIPPQSLEAERALLGCVLTNGEVFGEVNGARSTDFYRTHHSKIWKAFETLHEANRGIDIITVSERLRQAGELKGIGGDFYLTELIERVPSSARAKEYRDIVIEASTKRKFVHLCQTILGQAQNGIAAADLFENIQSELFTMTERQDGRGLEHISVGMDDLIERIEKLAAGDGLIGLPTGYGEIDRIILGLQKQQMIVVAARPGMGKTSLALSIVHYLGMKRIPVGFFSLEMSIEQLQVRLLSLDAGLASNKVRTGQMDELGWNQVAHAVGRIKDYPIYLDDSCRQDPKRIRDKVRRAIIQYKLKAVFVDYLQLMVIEDLRRSDSRATEIARISEGLKSAAKEFDLPIIVLSQLSRACEKRGGGILGKMPRLDDLRESGAIEQDSDIVLFIMRPEIYQKDDEQTIKWHGKDVSTNGLALIKIGKGRDCEAGRTVPLKFIPSRTQFTTMDFEHEEG